MTATMRALVPVWVDDQYGQVMFYVIPGATFSFGRPIMETKGLSIDYGKAILTFSSGGSEAAQCGRKGRYVVKLGRFPERFDGEARLDFAILP